MMDNFDLAIPAAGLPQLVPTILREEWRCALMEHLEQSVMWAGTNWMLKLLAVNLATTQQVSVGRPTKLDGFRNSDLDIATYVLPLHNHKH